MSNSPGGALGALAERVKGTAKHFAGTVLGNEDLKREGTLHHDKAEATLTASKLEDAAERAQRKAETKTREQQVENERAHLAVDAAADRREQQVDRERAREEQAVAAEAQRRTAATEQQAKATQEALTRQERQAARERSKADQRAAGMDAKAKSAERTAEALDPDSKEDGA